MKNEQIEHKQNELKQMRGQQLVNNGYQNITSFLAEGRQTMTTPIEVKIYGTRGSEPQGNREYMEFGGDTSSYAITYGQQIHFLDAGTGLKRALKENLTSTVTEAYLDITHGHLDHTYMGGAAGIYYNHLREGIQVSGYKDIEEALQGLFDNNIRWPVPLSQLNGLNKKINSLDGEDMLLRGTTVVTTMKNYHPHDGGKSYGGSLGFRYNFPGVDRVLSVAYVTDMEFDYKEGGVRQELSDKLRSDFVEFVRDADVLIADTQYTNEEYNNTLKFVRGWGHPTVEQIIELAKYAGVKDIRGSHHAPTRTDVMLHKLEEYAKNYALQIGYNGNFSYARDGDRITLGSTPFLDVEKAA